MTRKQISLFSLILGVMVASTLPAMVLAQSITNTKIAFQSERDGNSEIYVMTHDGSRQTRLTTNHAYDGSPRWSPDETERRSLSNPTEIVTIQRSTC